MNIIEKLGITPGPWVKDYGGTLGHIKSVVPELEKDRTPTVCVYSNRTLEWVLSEQERESNSNLIAAAPEMLETLIGMCIEIDKAGFIVPDWAIPPIEKATTLTWPQVKQLRESGE